MDQVNKLGQWKTLLDSIEEAKDKNYPQTFKELKDLFQHLSPQTAIRFNNQLLSCTSRSNQIFSDLFDDIDLSDKALLCSYLRMLLSFGYFRMAQITFHIESSNQDADPDTIYQPNIEKAKWYDLTPLLPGAGSIGWKGIMNGGIVNEEKETLQICLQLLSQKLHFYSIISLLEQFGELKPIIRRNGEKVAEKLLEMIKDVAHDDQSMIGMNATLFNLLLPFTDENQQAAVIEASVQDLFKPFLIQKPAQEDEICRIFEFIGQCVMTKGSLQQILISSLLEHLKCNIIRRKRRHSVELADETEKVTLESLISDIDKGSSLPELLTKSEYVTLKRKSFQTGYLSHWIQVVSKVFEHRIISASSAIKIIQTSCILLVVSSNIINQQLSQDISALLAKSFENTALITKLATTCDPFFLLSLTQALVDKTDLLSKFNSPILRFYRIVLRTNIKLSMLRGKMEEKLEQFINLICEGGTPKPTSHILQYICMHEIGSIVINSKHRHGNKKLESYVGFVKKCSGKLYKFIKRHSPLKSHLNSGDEMDEDEQESSASEQGTDAKHIVVIDALVCILRIAVECHDQEILDSYSDLLVKVYNAFKHRVNKLIQSTQMGLKEIQDPLDSQLSKLLTMYIEHKEQINPYLNENLIETVASFVIDSKPSELNGVTDIEPAKVKKKLVYSQIKSKLNDLDARAKKSDSVYSTLINKHYGSIIDPSIGQTDSIQKEKSCQSKYHHQMKTVNEILTILLSKCQGGIYNKVLQNTISELENCDPLDHSKVLYLFLLLESLILKRDQNENQKGFEFYKTLPRISCSLIRIAKTVEFGPSILVFKASGGHKSNRSIQCCTYSSCIKIHTLIFLNYPNKKTEMLITDALQLCISSNLIQYSKYSTRLHKYFVQLATAIIGLLKAMCMGRKEEDTLKSSMPTFLSVFSHLIRCLIIASDRQQLDQLQPQANGYVNDINSNLTRTNDETNLPRKEYESQLELIALDVGRTMNNLSFLKVKLIDYAPHLISTYIKDVQRGSCPDTVRLHLNEGIFRIFNLVDAHQKARREEILNAGIQRKTYAGKASGSLFEMIHARLDQASREIFKDLHDNYNRFYRYLGKC